MREDADLKWVLIVEDDCVPCLHPAAESQWSDFYGPAWQVAWRHIAKAMESCGEDFDFVYVGRHRLGPEDESDAVVRPAGFSSCLHAYCVTRQGCDRLLEKSANRPARRPRTTSCPLYAARTRARTYCLRRNRCGPVVCNATSCSSSNP